MGLAAALRTPGSVAVVSSVKIDGATARRSNRKYQVADSRKRTEIAMASDRQCAPASLQLDDEMIRLHKCFDCHNGPQMLLLAAFRGAIHPEESMRSRLLPFRGNTISGVNLCALLNADGEPGEGVDGMTETDRLEKRALFSRLKIQRLRTRQITQTRWKRRTRCFEKTAQDRSAQTYALNFL